MVGAMTENEWILILAAAHIMQRQCQLNQFCSIYFTCNVNKEDGATEYMTQYIEKGCTLFGTGHA